MFCFHCYDFHEQKYMHKCEKCNMYFCEECHLDHITTPDLDCEPRFKEFKSKISRIKKKSKHNHKLKSSLCDFCHREFLEIDLIEGEEPFASEIYGKGQWCKLCEQCYKESCDEI